MSSFDITDEQAAVVESGAPNLLVNAFVGTGKTSTLVAYTKRRPGKRFTYLAFNRSIKEEAIRRFPANVKCVTTHGLAFGPVGSMYKAKGKDGISSPRPYQVAEVLKISQLAAGKSIEILNRFLASADPALHPCHMSGTIFEAKEQEPLFETTKNLWSRMRDVNDPGIPMPHDGYLKLYQLSSPAINSDIILFDEFQDANPVTTALVMAQPGAKVMVGDSHQAIYGFRGAVNAMAAFKDAARLDLTKSFRFGDGVAQVASALLRDWKGETRTIKGMGRHPTVFSVDQSAPHTKLARTNGELFRAAVDALSSGRKFGYVGGVEGYRLDTILDVYRLFSGRRGDVKDAWIRSFEDFSSLQEYALTMDEKELKMLASITDEYNKSIPSLVKEIKERAVAVMTGEEIALSTVHKAKGLEFDSVVLLDDFAELSVKHDENGEEVRPSAEEINILYVATTRAERCLELNEKTLSWIEESGRRRILKADTSTKKGAHQETVIRPAKEPAVVPAISPQAKVADGNDDERYLTGFALGLLMALQKIDKSTSSGEAVKSIVNTLRDARLKTSISQLDPARFSALLKKHSIV